MKSITCNSCGAEVKVYSIKQFECTFCGVEIKVNEILSDKIKFNGIKANYTEFEQYKQLLSTAINGNDFDSSYQYLKNLITLDPKNQKLWELVAQYHFSSKKFSYENEDFNLFKKYLKNYENLSNINSIIFLDLIDQVYSLFFKKYTDIQFDKSRSGKVWDSFSDEKITLLINFFEISKLHFDCFSKNEVLKRVVLELSGQKKDFWLNSNQGNVETVNYLKKFNFDALSFRKNLIDILMLNDNSYVEPEIKYQNNYSVSKSNGNCFIATLCYNNFNHPNVILLRQFRDKSLSPYYLGKSFVDFYYLVSPSFVNHIRNKKKIIYLIKFLILDPLTFLIKLSHGNIWTFTRRKRNCRSSSKSKIRKIKIS